MLAKKYNGMQEQKLYLVISSHIIEIQHTFFIYFYYTTDIYFKQLMKQKYQMSSETMSVLPL